MTTHNRPTLESMRMASNPTSAQAGPSIRLISGTPSASGMSSEANTSASYVYDFDAPAVTAPLSPRASAPRKRLVPKKSKLGLLVGNPRDKERGFDDIVRRVGGDTSSARGGFEIYVDPTDDSELGEILLVKKQKSRAGLSALGWGAPLGDVQNVTKPQEEEKAGKEKKEKKDDKKWWTMGKGKDKTKEKAKAKEPPQAYVPPRSKTPEPFRAPPTEDSRARFNSFNAGSLLSAPFLRNNSSTPSVHDLPQSQGTLRPEPMRSVTPTVGGLLAPPNAAGENAANSGSIAIRAMRSMRSMARLGSWNVKPEDIPLPPSKTTTKEPSKKDAGTKKDKKKKKTKTKDTVRSSGSSFEAGTLSVSPAPVHKKKSILGLGLPSSMRLPTVRGGSTASSVVAQADLNKNRLSVEDAVISGRPRSGSAMTQASTNSSLRPTSYSSGTSRASSCVSVKWDEDHLETVREQRYKDREFKAQIVAEQQRRTSRESRHSSEGRRRTPLSDVFPDAPEAEDEEEQEGEDAETNDDHDVPVVVINSATSDGHSSIDTPVKRARPRPVSEQLLGRSRPQGFREDEGQGVLTLLDAATSELATLINTLDLEATPASPERSPRVSALQRLQDFHNSPTRAKTHRKDVTSISSLRPYGTVRSPGRSYPAPSDLIGQRIMSWDQVDMPEPPAPRSQTAAESTPPQSPAFALKHKRTLTPGPQPDPSPVIRPLRPARSRAVLSHLQAPGPPPDSPSPSRPASGVSWTSSRPSSRLVPSWSGRNELATHPLFMAARMKHSPEKLGQAEDEDDNTTSRRPLAPGAKRMLGMKGTMGGSDVSAYAASVEIDASDPDSDIPGELQVILEDNRRRSSERFDDTVDFGPLSDSLRVPQDDVPDDVSEPSSPQPVFRAQIVDEYDHYTELDDEDTTGTHDEDKTTGSFDFTGEINKLNQSGGSDRHSFVEQLEHAFKTPAKVDLRSDFGGFLTVDAPPVPVLPLHLRKQENPETSASGNSLEVNLSQITEHAPEEQSDEEPLPTFRSEAKDAETRKSFDMLTTAELRNMIDPSLRPSEDDGEDLEMELSPPPILNRSTRSNSSASTRGELDRSFRFGGSSTSPPKETSPREEKPLTLSDIIPSPEHARALSFGEDDSMIKSILAQAQDVPAVQEPRPRVDSEASLAPSIARYRPVSIVADSLMDRHSRAMSGISFQGYDSFEEVRRGFEFNDQRPAFYPPEPVARHRINESMFSIASVSSYGDVLNNGVADPFDYGDVGLPSLAERPSSEDLSCMSMSMSYTVDDTFDFHDRARKHRRIDSDASSFYYRPAALQARRSHRRNDSMASQHPPNSRYNRSFGIYNNSHRRDDSSMSMSSIAHSYANGRAAWARGHQQDASVDSIASDMSLLRLGRPGVGDKMFNTAMNGPGLTAISDMSPNGSEEDESVEDSGYYQPAYDSVIDRTSIGEDSLFDRSDMRSVGEEESFFNFNPLNARQLRPPVYRPLSILSFGDRSVHAPREDDTMISMLGGGGRERRESIGSLVDKSPCYRVEKRKHSAFANGQMNRKSHVATQPSIASTADSMQFGEERMIKARHGDLARRSLEESCLVAEGEDTSFSFAVDNVFSRPISTSTRSRSSTYSTMSGTSGTDTPPLSMSDGNSSMSDGSQSSIDVSALNAALANATHPLSFGQRSRMRARGHGHRNRISQARMSRASIYESIEEEVMSPEKDDLTQTKGNSPTVVQPVFVVDEDTASFDHSGSTTWDDERGIVAMRRFHELRDEAEYTVEESRRKWMDTAFSLYALQGFNPPKNPTGMRALLEHSVQNYGPLPPGLRPLRLRSRTSSRASPYPSTKVLYASTCPENDAPAENPVFRKALNPLHEVSRNVEVSPTIPADVPKVKAQKQGNKNALGLPARPRVGSTARRSALGWSKRGSGKPSSELKENAATPSFSMTPGESLRLTRPRPKGRPTPARALAASRV